MTYLRGESGRRVAFALWCLAWVVVAVLLLTPLDAPATPGGDKVAHLVVFGGLAFGAIGFCRRGRTLAILAAVTLAGGWGLELAQGLVPSRQVELGDAVANAGGAALGFLAALGVLACQGRRVAPAAGD